MLVVVSAHKVGNFEAKILNTPPPKKISAIEETITIGQRYKSHYY